MSDDKKNKPGIGEVKKDSSNKEIIEEIERVQKKKEAETNESQNRGS